MDVVHRLGRASVSDVMTALSGNPTYSTVRAQLRVLEEKGHLRHEEEQLRYVYLPAESPQKVRRSAVKHLIETFFEGSPEKVVEALVGATATGSRTRARTHRQLIERARRKGSAGDWRHRRPAPRARDHPRLRWRSAAERHLLWAASLRWPACCRLWRFWFPHGSRWAARLGDAWPASLAALRPGPRSRAPT
jgi:predicted transcriptional regulator